MAAVLCSTLATAASGQTAEPSETADDAVAEAVARSILSADEFLDAFDQADLDGLSDLGPAPSIAGDAASDAQIRQAAESRGYRRQPTPDRPLIAVGRHQLQPEAAAGWESLKAAANEAGHNITIRSAYRSHGSQRAVFHKLFRGTSAAALDMALTLVAPPGYSRHHTGYAIDITEGDNDFNFFGETASYRWLAADNFANAKAHGWVPSYPANSRPTGPDPEPWEFVWVGAVNIICAAHQPTPTDPFCDTLGSQFRADIDWLHGEGITTGCRPNRFCGDGLLTRAQAAALLWRYAGRPAATADIPFLDVPGDSYYSQAVQWMFERGITTGTSATTFHPQRPVSRAEFVTFLWRMASRPKSVSNDYVFADVSSANFAAEAIAWAVENGIADPVAYAGVATQASELPVFLPGVTANRETAAALVHRFAVHQAQPDDDPSGNGQADDNTQPVDPSVQRV